MERDTEITDMIFRCDKGGDFKDVVFALFPHEVDDRNGHVTFYTHIGQHGIADYKYSIDKSRPATAEEIKDLKAELDGRGYNINIVKKQDSSKYVKSWDKVCNMLGS